MKITVIGAGAMGSIYGSLLSTHHDVQLIDTNTSLVETINRDGIRLLEGSRDTRYFPKAKVSADGSEEADLVILFVKSLYSRAALAGCRGIIGDRTCVLTLQNGSGHEDILREFVPEDRIIIGTTEDNGTVLAPAYIRRGGQGVTNIGMLTEDTNQNLPRIKEAFDSCGFQTQIHENIQMLIWDKLFINVSLSALTGVLQVPIGFITADSHAWRLAEQLVHEAVAVAAGLGLSFEEAAVLEKVKHTSLSSPDGYTSIYADLKCGKKTEVDAISGSVVRASEICHIPAPTHRFIVGMIHAMEDKN